MTVRTVQIVTIREVTVYADTDEEAIDAVVCMVESGDACASGGDVSYLVTDTMTDEEHEATQ